MTLIATPGDPLANAYCDMQQATLYLQEHLETQAWYAESPDDEVTLLAKREAALITATRLLDAQMQWPGSPTFSTQALGWPRTGASSPQGQALDPSTVPATIQRATAYYALSLLPDPQAGGGQGAAGNIKRKVLGDTTIEYFGPTATPTAAQATGIAMPAEVQLLLKGWSYQVSAIVVPLVRA
jgi:Putative DnaT-like ssDNA binding protein